jgi:hypothetical protein
MNLDIILNLAKEKKIDIDLSFRTVTKTTKLLKKIALSMKEKPEDLAKLFNTDGNAFFSKLNSFIADDYDDVNDDYGVLSKELLHLLKTVTKGNENIEDMQILDIFQKINDVVSSLKVEGQDSFLSDMDTTLSDIIEPLDTIETEN